MYIINVNDIFHLDLMNKGTIRSYNMFIVVEMVTAFYIVLVS